MSLWEYTPYLNPNSPSHHYFSLQRWDLVDLLRCPILGCMVQTMLRAQHEAHRALLTAGSRKLTG
jgi:hypothetical protein